MSATVRKHQTHFPTQVKRPDSCGRTNTQGVQAVLKSRFCTREAVEQFFEKARTTLPQGASQRERDNEERVAQSNEGDRDTDTRE